MPNTLPSRRATRTVVPFNLLFLLAALACCAHTPATALAQEPEDILATVNGRAITRREVDASVLSQIHVLERQIYSLRKAALENLIDRAVLEEEARRQNLSPAELRRRLTAAPVEVSTARVEQTYLESASALVQMSPDEARERIRLDLENHLRIRAMREVVRRLRERSEVRVLLTEPRLPHAAGGRGPSLGPEGAPVTIIEFSDFQCPYCRQAQVGLKQVLTEYAGQVRLVFKHLPLSTHRLAFEAAAASNCAGEQGRFWQYHDALFAEAELSQQGFARIAAALGLDDKKFRACLDSEGARTSVAGDMEEARRLGIEATPTFIINGRIHQGALTPTALKAAVERELISSAAKDRAEQGQSLTPSLKERR
ncbi:MAG TPA: thioredoxin domain-containing protein [Pyrinomonadaceae bacterium]|nr:thioredoxin domain-containing protein [Pyrinomonadaceae bacterium]